MEHQDEHSHGSKQTPQSFFRGPLGVAIVMVVMIGVFYLLREHWYHIVGYWPYLLLLLCPLMHLFMGHGGHGGHGGGSGSETQGNK